MNKLVTLQVDMDEALFLKYKKEPRKYMWPVVAEILAQIPHVPPEEFAALFGPPHLRDKAIEKCLEERKKDKE